VDTEGGSRSGCWKGIEKCMLRREPNMSAGGGLEVDAWRGAK